MSIQNSTSTHSVLIIDDEADIREVASLSLEMTEGWRVAVAESCLSGIFLSRTFQADVILLDVMMPDMDGPTGFTHFQEEDATRNIPVIFLTAKVHQGDIRELLALGASGVISKPFDPLTLGTRIREILGWPDAAATADLSAALLVGRL